MLISPNANPPVNNNRSNPEPRTSRTLTPAGVSEALIIVAPVETVKTKCIDMNMPFLQGMKKIIATEGLGGLYQGAAATAMKQGSNQGLRFMWFNEYKKVREIRA